MDGHDERAATTGHAGVEGSDGGTAGGDGPWWSPGEAQALVERCWVRTRAGRRLHHAVVGDDFDAGCDGITTCGISSWLWVPGIFSRMSLARCVRCCALTGMPPGVGSPKNDEACRARLGLDAGS